MFSNFDPNLFNNIFSSKDMKQLDKDKNIILCFSIIIQIVRVLEMKDKLGLGENENDDF